MEASVDGICSGDFVESVRLNQVEAVVRDEVAVRLHHPRIRFVGVRGGMAASREPAG
jgi:hypothetical protein